jgi:hypothetical protein
MALVSQEVANDLLYFLTREKVQNALNPVLQSAGELTRNLHPKDQNECRLSLLQMVERAVKEIVSEQKNKLAVKMRTEGEENKPE